MKISSRIVALAGAVLLIFGWGCGAKKQPAPVQKARAQSASPLAQEDIDVIFIVDNSKSFVSKLEKQRRTSPLGYDDTMYVIASLGEPLEEPDVKITTTFATLTNHMAIDPQWCRRPYEGTETLIGYVRKNIISKNASATRGTYFTPAFQAIDQFAAQSPNHRIVTVILSDMGADEFDTSLKKTDPTLTRRPGVPDTDMLHDAIVDASKRQNIVCTAALLADSKDTWCKRWVTWLQPFGSRAVVSDDTRKNYCEATSKITAILGIQE